MNEQPTEQNEKELLEILDLAKDGENKLKVISEQATALAEKCKYWYSLELEKKHQKS
jgi:hypothetical protein